MSFILSAVPLRSLATKPRFLAIETIRRRLYSVVLTSSDASTVPSSVPGDASAIPCSVSAGASSSSADGASSSSADGATSSSADGANSSSADGANSSSADDADDESSTTPVLTPKIVSLLSARFSTCFALNKEIYDILCSVGGFPSSPETQPSSPISAAANPETQPSTPSTPTSAPANPVHSYVPVHSSSIASRVLDKYSKVKTSTDMVTTGIAVVGIAKKMDRDGVEVTVKDMIRKTMNIDSDSVEKNIAYQEVRFGVIEGKLEKIEDEIVKIGEGIDTLVKSSPKGTKIGGKEDDEDKDDDDDGDGSTGGSAGRSGGLVGILLGLASWIMRN